jgi:glucose/arabinose dehydrogenase
MRFIVLSLLVASTTVYAQNRIGTGAVEALYQQNCMSCHGPDLNQGLGGSLLDQSAWKRVGTDVSFIEYVKEGNLAMGMPAFGDALSEPEIRSLEIYIDEMRQKTSRSEGAPVVEKVDHIYSAGGYRFRLETVVRGLNIPWSLYFLSETSALITERGGDLRVWDNGKLAAPVQGIPKVLARGQGGLMEVAAHPEYDQNGWVYLGYSATAENPEDKNAGTTKIVRGRIENNRWQDEEVIFEVPERFHTSAGAHFGTRFVFQDGYLFFGIGDRGAQNQAQDLTRPNGKIHRIYDDGRVPQDNPFIDMDGAYPTIWTYGNRNPQGLDAHPVTGAIFESEHGPRGGDEINLIERGRNYGWPVITYGMNYSGTPITEKTAAPGMEQPLLYWTPSIAVCGIDFYEGDAFPDWKNNLFAGGLASQEVHRLVIEDNEVVHSEIILKDEGRVRDVATGPDGYLYLVLNGPDVIARLVPISE